MRVSGSFSGQKKEERRKNLILKSLFAKQIKSMATRTKEEDLDSKVRESCS